MAEDSLRSAIDAIRSRLHEELEIQLGQLTARHADELERARRATEAEAEQRWSSRVEEVRTEWTSRLESEVAAARADAERRMIAESMRLRVEAEQAAAESAAAVRDELERALAEERARAESQVAEANARVEEARKQLAAERARLEEHVAERARIEEQTAAERARIEEQTAAERARIEEQAVGERARMEEQLATERRRAEEQLNAERTRLGEEMAGDRQRLADEAAAERQRVAAERDEVQRALDAARHDLDGVRSELDRARQTLDTAAQERDGAIRDRDHAADRERRLTSELTSERQSREDDARRRQESDAALAEARVAERQSQLAIVERVLTAIRTMGTARSLSDVLASLTSSAASEAPRVALFVVNGTELRGWKSAGFSTPASSFQASVTDGGVLGEAMRRREPVVTGEGEGPAAPAFAELPPGRAAMAVPLLVGNQPVAVLYADDAADGTPASPASWPEAVQILGHHASVILAHLTAARAADAMWRSISPAAGNQPNGAPAAAGEDGNSARRYARLLVSEIKLYNEAAVRLGRQKRDLLARLKPEIERARKLYSQRISAAVDSRGALFQQELVQTLADGDASLLGNPA